MINIKHCPGTLKEGFYTYSKPCLNRLFDGKKVSHILPYFSPTSNEDLDNEFEDNRKRMSISGVQEKFSIIQHKNKLRLVEDGERGDFILKPIPVFGKKFDQMPANEHLTMQIAKQVFAIETADNALIFFKDDSPAYITKRFDINDDGSKLGQEDFASLAGRTPQTHGENYKYQGDYLELFKLMKKHIPAYKVEAPKLYKTIIFNYLFSNGDAHFKNFSILETPMGDYKLSPAYDLLNSKIHIEDKDFALESGLLPRDLAHGTVSKQLRILGDMAELSNIQVEKTFKLLLSQSEKVEKLVSSSFLDEKTKRSYLQDYQTRLKRLEK